MNVFSLLVLGCSFIAASGQPNAAALAGCSPDCRGTCFAGTCLFDETNVDDANAFRSSPFQQSTLDAVRAARLPLALPQSAPSLPSWTSGLMAHPEQPQTFMPSATATAGLGFQSVSVLENKAQELSFELQRAEAHEALLRAQNAKLEQQLEDWKATGANIAQRESKVMNLLGSASVKQNASAPSAPVAASLLQSTRQRFSQSTFTHGYFGSFFMTMGLLFIAASAWKTGRFIHQYRKGEVNWPSMSQALASSHRLHPVARAMGLVQYKVEISEIHLGSLFAGSSDVRVNFRMGNGTERRTKVLKNAGGTFLRFDDVLELSICGSDSPCIICVTDRRGDLAHVELASSHLLRLATRPHQEYFRTELTASRELGVTDGRRPYVAMRMRNVTAPPTMPAVPPARNVQAKSEQRVYGSFAV